MQAQYDEENRLIEVAQQHRCLWDKTDEQYLKRGAINDAWLEICREMDPEFDLKDHQEQEFTCKLVISKSRC